MKEKRERYKLYLYLSSQSHEVCHVYIIYLLLKICQVICFFINKNSILPATNNANILKYTFSFILNSKIFLLISIVV